MVRRGASLVRAAGDHDMRPLTSFCFDPPAKAITLNQRNHWAANARLVKEWRTAGWVYARQAKIGPQPPSRVTVTFPVSGNRRRDPHNWTPTVKAIVDGLVDAGVWPDDNSDWVATVEPVLDATATQVVVTISPLSKEEA